MTEKFEKDRFRDFKIMLPDEEQGDDTSTLDSTERPARTSQNEDNEETVNSGEEEIVDEESDESD